MYRHKHLWYKNILDIGPELEDDILSEVKFATEYFNQPQHYCPKCGCICTDQAQKSRVKQKYPDKPPPPPPPKPPAPVQQVSRPPKVVYFILNKFVCENCTYKREKKQEALNKKITINEYFEGQEIG
jgi:hypothetical protein